MRKLLFLSFFAFFLISCGSTKNTGKIPEAIIGKNEVKTKTTRKVSPHKNNKITAKRDDENTSEDSEESPKEIKKGIIDYAKTFQGTRYKFGGTTDAGMDCSGLVYTAFQKKCQLKKK